MSDRKEKAGAATEEVVVPVVEEEVDTATRTVKGRTVTVTTTPAVENHTVSEPVMREEVTVERVPVGKVIEAVPDIREEDDLTVIPVVEERITIVKELVLTEEIHLRRTRRETSQTLDVQLRTTNVEISD